MAGDGDDDASSSDAESVSSHDEYLAKKRCDADDFEADKHTCSSNKKAVLLGLGLSASQLSPYFAYSCSWVWTKWPPAA